jgi:hypothetical protein
MPVLAPASNLPRAPSLASTSAEDSNCKKMARGIVKIALPILVTLATAFLLHLALPSSLSLIRAIVIPVATTATLFALTFFFRVQQAEPELPLSATAPCGLKNVGNDCWMNSLAQLIRIDQEMRKWFTEVPDKLAEHSGYLEYFSQELLENLPEQLPQEVYLKLIEKEMDTPDNRQKLDEYANRIRRLNPAKKEHLFRYLRFLRPPLANLNDARPSAKVLADTLLTFKKFMQAYDAYDAGARRAPGQVLRAIPVRNRRAPAPPARPQPPAPFNSHELRLAVCRVSGGQLDEHLQIDPAEGITAGVQWLLPDELKGQMQERKHYDLPRNALTGAAQPFVDPQDGAEIRDGRIVIVNHPYDGVINCEMFGSFPNVKYSLDRFFEDSEEVDEPIKRTIDGINYEFPLVKTERQFLTAPKSLWLPAKRFRPVVSQWAGLHRMMPNWFDAQPQYQIKMEDPMEIQEILTIQPVQGGPARYKLDGFICHLGPTLDSGHYISYRRGKDDEGRDAWFKMNDELVTRISDAQMRAVLPTAYVPHYSRIDE